MIYRRIVCLTNGSERITRTERDAAYLAKVSGARLILLQVVEKWRQEILVTDSEEWEAIQRRWLEDGKERLERKAEELKGIGVLNIKTELRSGDTAYETITAAVKICADLLVIPNAWAGARKFFSSGFKNIIENSPCPILRVRQ